MNAEFFKNNWKNILLVVFGLVIITLLMSTTCTKQKLDKAETNIKALTDTIHVYELKNGELMYEKQGYIAEKKELEEYIGVKEKEVKELEKKLGSALATISKLKAEVHVDTVQMHDSVYIGQDSTYYNNFYYADDWLRVNGTSKFSFNPFNVNTMINDISMVANLKIGTSKDDQWFATTDNPYLQFTSIEGANLEKAKPKRWSLDVQFGVGGIFGYGISGANDGLVRSGWIVGAGGYVGMGISYKLLEL